MGWLPAWWKRRESHSLLQGTNRKPGNLQFWRHDADTRKNSGNYQIRLEVAINSFNGPAFSLHCTESKFSAFVESYIQRHVAVEASSGKRHMGMFLYLKGSGFCNQCCEHLGGQGAPIMITHGLQQIGKYCTSLHQTGCSFHPRAVGFPAQTRRNMLVTRKWKGLHCSQYCNYE